MCAGLGGATLLLHGIVRLLNSNSDSDYSLRLTIHFTHKTIPDPICALCIDTHTHTHRHIFYAFYIFQSFQANAWKFHNSINYGARQIWLRHIHSIPSLQCDENCGFFFIKYAAHDRCTRKFTYLWLFFFLLSFFLLHNICANRILLENIYI